MITGDIATSSKFTGCINNEPVQLVIFYNEVLCEIDRKYYDASMNEITDKDLTDLFTTDCSEFRQDPELSCFTNDGGETVVYGFIDFDTSVQPAVPVYYNINGEMLDGDYVPFDCDRDYEPEETLFFNGDGQWRVIYYRDEENPDNVLGPIYINPNGELSTNPGDLQEYEVKIEDAVTRCSCDSDLVFFHELELGENDVLRSIGIRGTIPEGATFSWDVWYDGSPSPLVGPPGIPDVNTTPPGLANIATTPEFPINADLHDQSEGSSPIRAYNNNWMRLLINYNNEENTIRYFLHEEGADEPEDSQFLMSKDNGATWERYAPGYYETKVGDLFGIPCDDSPAIRTTGCNDDKVLANLNAIKNNTDKAIRPADVPLGKSFTGTTERYVNNPGFFGGLTFASMTVTFTGGEGAVEVTFDGGSTRDYIIREKGSRTRGVGGSYAIAVDGIAFRGTDATTEYDVIGELMP